MTLFADIVAEEWAADDETIGPRGGIFEEDGRGFAVFGHVYEHGNTTPADEMRAAVAVLGKKALTIVLRVETCDQCNDNGIHCNVHGDEWRALLEEAKKLRVRDI